MLLLGNHTDKSMESFWNETAYFASHLNYHFRVWILPVALIVGTFGQLLTLKSCVTNKAWKSTGKIYYSLMAITDFLYLLSFGIISYMETGLNSLSQGIINFALAKHFGPTCKLFPYAFHVLISVSFWNLSAYSLERLLAIWFPFIRIQYLNEKRSQCLRYFVHRCCSWLPANFVHECLRFGRSRCIHWK